MYGVAAGQTGGDALLGLPMRMVGLVPVGQAIVVCLLGLVIMVGFIIGLRTVMVALGVTDPRVTISG